MKPEKPKSSNTLMANFTANLKRAPSASKQLQGIVSHPEKTQKSLRQKSYAESSMSRRQINNTTLNMFNSDSLSKVKNELSPHYSKIKKKVIKGLKRDELIIETPQLSTRNLPSQTMISRPTIQISAENRASSITVVKPRMNKKDMISELSDNLREKFSGKQTAIFALKPSETNMAKKKVKKTISKSVGKINGSLIQFQNRIPIHCGAKDLSQDLAKTKTSILPINDFKKVHTIKQETAASSRRVKKQIAFKNNTKKSLVEIEKGNPQVRLGSPRATSGNKSKLKVVAGKNDMKFIKEKLELLMQKIDGLNIRRSSPHRQTIVNSSSATSRILFNNYAPESAKQLQRQKHSGSFKKLDTTKTRKVRPNPIEAQNESKNVNSRGGSPEKQLLTNETLQRFAQEIRSISPSFQNSLEKLTVNNIRGAWEIDKLFDQCKQILDSKLEEALRQLRPKSSFFNEIDQQAQKARFDAIAKAKKLYQRQLEGLEKTRGKMKIDLQKFEQLLKNKNLFSTFTLPNRIPTIEIKLEDHCEPESARSRSKLRSLIQSHMHTAKGKFNKTIELNFNNRYSLEKIDSCTPFNKKDSVGGNNSIVISKGKAIISDPDLISLKLESASKLFRHNLKTNNSAFSDNSSVKSVLLEPKIPGNITPVNASLEKSSKINPRHFNFQFLDPNVQVKDSPIKKLNQTSSIQAKLPKQSQLSGQKPLTFNFKASEQIIDDLFNTILQEELTAVLSQTTKKKASKRKTGLIISADQIEKFCKRAIKFFIKHHKDQILKQLNADYGLTVLQKLEEFASKNEYDLSIVNEYSNNPVVDKNMINQFFFSYKFHEKEQSMIQLEKSNKKMLFDCLNEALCSWRPYAFRGSPMIWRPSLGCSYKVVIRPDDINTITEISIGKIREWSMLSCGLLNEKFSSATENFLEIKEEELEMLREDRLTKFLNWETYETDERWLWYENEAIEALIETEQAIWDDLLVDTIQFLNSL